MAWSEGSALETWKNNGRDRSVPLIGDRMGPRTGSERVCSGIFHSATPSRLTLDPSTAQPSGRVEILCGRTTTSFTGQGSGMGQVNVRDGRCNTMLTLPRHLGGHVMVGVRLPTFFWGRHTDSHHDRAGKFAGNHEDFMNAVVRQPSAVSRQPSAVEPTSTESMSTLFPAGNVHRGSLCYLPRTRRRSSNSSLSISPRAKRSSRMSSGVLAAGAWV